MYVSYEVIEKMKKKLGLKSDYQLAMKTGWSTSSISNYKTGDSQLTPERVVEAAKLLGMNAGEIQLKLIENSNIKPEQKDAWRKILTWGKAVAPALVITVLAGAEKFQNCILC